MVLFGKCIPELELRIDNKDENGIGEILVKGDSVTEGYFEDKTKT